MRNFLQPLSGRDLNGYSNGKRFCNMEAVLQASIAANREIYNEIRRQSKMPGVLWDFLRKSLKKR